MTHQEIVAFFAERDTQWTARNPSALAAGHAAEGRVISPMHGDLYGRQAIEESYCTLLSIFPDWRFSSEELFVNGDRVAQVFTADATHVGEFMGLPGTNRRFRIQGVRLYDMVDGLIQTERRLYDFTGLLIQVGVLRSKPAA
jgi:predicted ester cyclase